MRWIRGALREWLGIQDFSGDISELSRRLDEVEAASRVSMEAVRKAVNAKMDSRSPFDPERKAESDAIGDRVLKQLYAEDAARRHTEGKA